MWKSEIVKFNCWGVLKKGRERGIKSGIYVVLSHSYFRTESNIVTWMFRSLFIKYPNGFILTTAQVRSLERAHNKIDSFAYSQTPNTIRTISFQTMSNDIPWILKNTPQKMSHALLTCSVSVQNFQFLTRIKTKLLCDHCLSSPNCACRSMNRL